jgi:hypothetical protein
LLGPGVVDVMKAKPTRLANSAVFMDSSPNSVQVGCGHWR